MDKKDRQPARMPLRAEKCAKPPFLIHTLFIIAYIGAKVNIMNEIPARRKKNSPKQGSGEGLYSSSLSQPCTQASEGMRQSPRGERPTEPTLTPSGRQERLNCCEKNRR